MSKMHDITLPQDSLARPLTPEEVEQVGGGDFSEPSEVKPDTSRIVTGCNPPLSDADWD